MHFTSLRPLELILFHVEVRRDVLDEVKCYSSWKGTSSLHILFAMYIYAF